MSYFKPNTHPDRLIRPVICTGIPNGNSVSLLPFMCVDFFKAARREKQVLINWTYGKPSNDVNHQGQNMTEEIVFDGELGQIKLLQFQSLQDETRVEVRFMLPSERGRSLSERIREVIECADDGSRVLFVLPNAINDKEFYAALSIFVDPDSKEVQMNDNFMGEPVVSLRELGLVIANPFVEVDPRQVM